MITLFTFGRLVMTALLTTASIPFGQSQGTPPSVTRHQLAQQLTMASGPERAAAVRKIAAMPASELDGEIVRALVSELDRKNGDNSELARAVRSGKSYEISPRLRVNDADPEAEFDYTTSLLVEVVRAHSDLGLHALVGALGFGAGAPAQDEIARFGDRAMPYLEARARTALNEPGEALWILSALNRLLDNPKLSARSRSRVGDLARPQLSGRRSPAVAMKAMEIGLKLGDAKARQVVNAIAEHGTAGSGLTLTSPAMEEIVTKRAQELRQTIR